MTCTITKLAPPSAFARKITKKALGRTSVTVREIADHCEGKGEWRDIPEKLEVMHRLLTEAWELVHRLDDLGVKFAGSLQEATLVIAGTAYAAWRVSLDRKSRAHEPANLVLVVAGMNDGLEFALWNKSGIPAMHADDYLNTVADSDDPIDRLTPIEALAEVWPQWYAGGRLRLTKPQYAEPEANAAPGWGDELWDHRPNVLTASHGELRRAKTAARAKWQKAAKARKPKAK